MVAVSIIGVILVLLAVVLTVMILLQTGKEKGLSGRWYSRNRQGGRGQTRCSKEMVHVTGS